MCCKNFRTPSYFSFLDLFYRPSGLSHVVFLLLFKKILFEMSGHVGTRIGALAHYTNAECPQSSFQTQKLWTVDQISNMPRREPRPIKIAAMMKYAYAVLSLAAPSSRASPICHRQSQRNHVAITAPQRGIRKGRSDQ